MTSPLQRPPKKQTTQGCTNYPWVEYLLSVPQIVVYSIRLKILYILILNC